MLREVPRGFCFRPHLQRHCADERPSHGSGCPPESSCDTNSNLAKYRLSKQRNQHPLTSYDRFKARRDLDIRLEEMLGEVLLVFSDELKPNPSQTWYVFTVAAAALWDLMVLVQPVVGTNTLSDKCWDETHLQRRLFNQQKCQFHQQYSTTAAMMVSTAKRSSRSRDGTLLEQYLTQATSR